MSRKSVSNLIYKTVLEKYKSCGSDINKILNSVAMSEYEIEKKGGRIAAENHYRLQSALPQLKNIDGPVIYEDLLINAMSYAYQMFPELIGLSLNQSSLDNALSAFIDNIFVIGNCDSLSVNRGSASTQISYISSGPDHLQEPSAIGNILLLSDLIRHYSPEAVLKINLQSKFIANKALFDDKFRSHALLNQNENSIVIENKYLFHEHENFNPGLYELQSKHIFQTKNNIFTSKEFSSMVKDIINNVVLNKKTVEQSEVFVIVCNVLKMSRWTVNRRLRQEDNSFTKLLNEVKINISIKLLQETNLSIQEISDWLSFSSHSGFSRFFKSVMMISPTHYRERFYKN